MSVRYKLALSLSAVFCFLAILIGFVMQYFYAELNHKKYREQLDTILISDGDALIQMSNKINREIKSLTSLRPLLAESQKNLELKNSLSSIIRNKLLNSFDLDTLEAFTWMDTEGNKFLNVKNQEGSLNFSDVNNEIDPDFYEMNTAAKNDPDLGQKMIGSYYVRNLINFNDQNFAAAHFKVIYVYQFDPVHGLGVLIVNEKIPNNFIAPDPNIGVWISATELKAPADNPFAKVLKEELFSLKLDEESDFKESTNVFKQNDAIVAYILRSYNLTVISNQNNFLLRISFLSSLTLSIIGFILASLLSHRFVKPLHTLLEGVKAVAAGDLNRKVSVEPGKYNEFGILGEAFNHMSNSLKISYENLKETERLKMELETAQIVQELLIPRSNPVRPEIEIASFFKSASETGGDWYDFRYHEEFNTLDILIGDVTGHGTPAALITAIVDSFYASLEEHRQLQMLQGSHHEDLLSPSYLLQMLNKILYSTTNGLYGMTFFFSIIDLSKKTLTYSSAAHTSCYVWRPSKFTFVNQGKTVQRNIIDLNIISNRLGYAAENTYEIRTQELQTDDVIVWYTDGLTENKNHQGEKFGTRNLKSLLLGCKGFTAEEIKNHIVQECYQHYGAVPQEDDVTLIVGRIK